MNTSYHSNFTSRFASKEEDGGWVVSFVAINF